MPAASRLSAACDSLARDGRSAVPARLPDWLPVVTAVIAVIAVTGTLAAVAIPHGLEDGGAQVVDASDLDHHPVEPDVVEEGPQLGEDVDRRRHPGVRSGVEMRAEGVLV